MKKILHIISSINGNNSFSIKLGNAVIEKIKETYPGSTVQETDLVKKNFPHLEEMHLTSFYTPKENRTPKDLEAIKHSEEAIKQLMEADIIVIGAPLYNFAIPSTLQAWIGHLTRKGETFNYGENGPEGLIKGKKVYIAAASGGIYSEGPMQPYDFVVPYLKAVLGFLGMTDLSVFRVEGTAIPGIQDSALEKGISSIAL